VPNGQHIPDDAPGWAGYLIGQVGGLTENAKKMGGSLERIHARLDKSNDVDRDFAQRITAVESEIENCPTRKGGTMPPAPPADATPRTQKLAQIVTRRDLIKFVIFMLGAGAFVTGVLVGIMKLVFNMEIDIPGV